MKRFLLVLVLLCISTCQPVYAGYEAVVLPQISQFVQVQGANGLESWPNPAAHMQPVGMFCKPSDFARHDDDPVKRTVVVRSETGSLTNAQVLAICPGFLDDKYDRLLKAAQAHEAKSISGVGLSILALGVAQQKPKAMACAMWTQQLWSAYYERKALVAVDLAAEINIDFSGVGEMPYSVTELSAEVWQ